jgi:hypothetical protein
MINELLDWLADLEPGFAFLLALPFLVAAAGLLGDAVRKWRSRTRAQQSQRQVAAMRNHSGRTSIRRL